MKVFYSDRHVLHAPAWYVADGRVRECPEVAGRAGWGGGGGGWGWGGRRGHQGGRDYGGGFCYLNNAAVGAERLLMGGKKRVAILDVDYHHGNGTQDIFYGRGDVLFVSVHA